MQQGSLSTVQDTFSVTLWQTIDFRDVPQFSVSVTAAKTASHSPGMSRKDMLTLLHSDDQSFQAMGVFQ